jgi:hypothetical protein
MSSLVRRFPIAAAALCALSMACSDGPPPECQIGSDCAAGFCVDERCVECVANTDCSATEACCRGICRGPETFDELCGCDAAPSSNNAEECGGTTPACLANGVAVTAATLSDGVCGCACTPGEGGSECVIEDGGVVTCQCDRNNPVVTCEAPSFDVNNRPHKVADTCTPDTTCVCFAAGTVCGGIDGYDCTSAGCIDLLRDVDGCGLAGLACTDPLRSLDDGTGTCVQGGCTCDSATDCAGPGLPVDSCAFVTGGATTQCVCSGYRANGVAAACPFELACVTGGCQLNGTAYAEEDDLVAELR